MMRIILLLAGFVLMTVESTSMGAEVSAQLTGIALIASAAIIDYKMRYVG